MSTSSNEGKDIANTKVEEIEESKPRPTLGTRIKAHYKKWWWVHVIITVCVTLVIVLPLVFVAYPKIAQDGINDSTLNITSLTLSNPTPDSFHLDQTAEIGNDSKYHPNLDAFNVSLSIDGSDTPYAYITLPAVHATKTATTHVDQDVQITDVDEFARYNALVMGSEEVKLAVKGRTALHEMQYQETTVDYRKMVTMKGLNKLAGFNVTSFSIKLKADPDGTNMIGMVYIPNPTVMTLSMGNVTFSNHIQGTYIGISTLENLVLAPGNNTVPMRSVINQTIVATKLATDFKNGLVPVDITGNSSVYNGQHLPYFEKALQALTNNITLNVGEALANAG